MKFNLLPSSEIEKLRMNEQIIRDTSLQVIKDFATFGMKIVFPDDIRFAYEILYDQLTIIIKNLSETEPEKLSALLYQIDLDEYRINPGPAHIADPVYISKLILEREFVKVLTRYYFKNYPEIKKKPQIDISDF